jgi:hypothetical protein
MIIANTQEHNTTILAHGLIPMLSIKEKYMVPDVP